VTLNFFLTCGGSVFTQKPTLTSFCFQMSTATDIDNEVAPTVQDLGMRNSGGGLAVSGGSSRGNGRVGNVNMMGLVPKLWEKGSTPTGTPKVTPRSTDEIVQARARSRSNEKDSRHAGRSQERPNSKRNESGRSKEREGDLASLAAMPGYLSMRAPNTAACVRHFDLRAHCV
jgi:hypothetical protein